MNKNSIILGLVGLIVVILVIGYFLWPTPTVPPVEQDGHEETIVELLREIDSLENNSTSLMDQIDSITSYSVTRETQLAKENVRLNRKIKRLEANVIIISVRDSIPEVDSLIVALHTSNEIKTFRIKELGHDLMNVQSLVNQLELTYDEKEKLHGRMVAELSERNAALENDNRKLVKKLRITRIGALVIITIITVAAL